MRVKSLYCVALAVVAMTQVRVVGKKQHLVEETEERRLKALQSFGSDPKSRYPLNQCQGDCDKDAHCKSGLTCFQRNSNEPVPGCIGGANDDSRTDYCVDPADLQGGLPTLPPVRTNPDEDGKPALKSYGASPPNHRFPLQECEGDCDQDKDCATGLKCLQRKKFDPVPGCAGSDPSRTDYCVRGNGDGDPVPTPADAAPEPIGSPPSPSAGLSNFRLKLYWQQGYYWQEESFERKWCMSCRNDGCKDGNKIYISECGGKSQRFDFVEVDDDQALIQLHGKNLCFEREYKDIYVYPCDFQNPRQQWFAKKGAFDDYRFEISQIGFSGYCITQRHHPKTDEEVELEPCTLARRGETSFWNRY